WNSSCEVWMPVSTMPTLTPPLFGKLPSPALSQPSGALMSASAVPPAWPVLCRPQSWPKSGSLGTAWVVITALTSAYSTTADLFSRSTALRGSPATRSVIAPVPAMLATLPTTPASFCTAERWPADADDLNFTMTESVEIALLGGGAAAACCSATAVEGMDNAAAASPAVAATTMAERHLRALMLATLLAFTRWGLGAGEFGGFSG